MNFRITVPMPNKGQFPKEEILIGRILAGEQEYAQALEKPHLANLFAELHAAWLSTNLLHRRRALLVGTADDLDLVARILLYHCEDAEKRMSDPVLRLSPAVMAAFSILAVMVKVAPREAVVPAARANVAPPFPFISVSDILRDPRLLAIVPSIG